MICVVLEEGTFSHIYIQEMKHSLPDNYNYVTQKSLVRVVYLFLYVTLLISNLY